mgnify:CR=1 FL=1
MLRYAVIVLAGACSFGVMSTFVKLAYSNGYSLGEVAGAQYLFGILILWSLVVAGRVTGRTKKRPSGGRDPVWRLVLSGLPVGMVSVFLYKSMQFLPASIAIILLMQFVWIGIVIELLVFKVRPTPSQIVSMFLIMGGTLMAAGLFNEQQIELSAIGVIYGLVAAFFFSIYLIVMARVGYGYTPVEKSAVIITGAGFFIFLIFPPVYIFNGTLTGGLWRWGLLMSTFGTVVPPLFFAVGTPRIGATLSSILASAELPVAVALSYFILSEEVTALQWVGIAVILMAIAISNLSKKRT